VIPLYIKPEMMNQLSRRLSSAVSASWLVALALLQIEPEDQSSYQSHPTVEKPKTKFWMIGGTMKR
jgi:hypothetical protein